MLRHASCALGALPFFALNFDTGGGGASCPRRKSFLRPETGEAFILPIRQSFVKDARLMPGTTRMLCLLAGWYGQGRPIETTLGVLAKHLKRSPRQIQRYLKDAVEEGYLSFSKVANRFGYIVGLRIRLNRAAIYAAPRKRPAQAEEGTSPSPARPMNRPLIRRNPATTDRATTNENLYITKPIDPVFEQKLRSICIRNGIAYPE